MEPFARLLALAVPYFEANIDTDQLVPARFLGRRRKGLGEVLLYDQRFDAGGAPRPGFILDRPMYRDAKILVAGRNFGCGSSREAAVWALQDFGFRAIVAPSFGDIFSANCLKNFILPVALSEAVVVRLCEELAAAPQTTLGVDLERQILTDVGGREHGFETPSFQRDMLLSGQDELGMTLSLIDRIQAYETELSRR